MARPCVRRALAAIEEAVGRCHSWIADFTQTTDTSGIRSSDYQMLDTLDSDCDIFTDIGILSTLILREQKVGTNLLPHSYRIW